MRDYIDHDPGTDSDDPLECVLELIIDGDQAIFDYTKSAPAAVGAINGTLPVTTSGVMCALKGVFPEIEMCSGINRAIEIRTVPGSIFHALWPVPTSGMSGTSFQKSFDLVLGCLAQVVPERVMACPAAETNYVQAGDDPRDDTLFDDYIFYVWTEGGYGARRDSDNGTYITVFASGTMNQSVEVYEQLYPILWEKMELIADSGGAGRQRGGLGDMRRVRLAYGERGRLSSFGDRERFRPWGLEGGKPGANQGFVINSGTPEEVSIGVMITGYDIKKDDVSDYWSGGGGGFGDPLDRPTDLVLEDVKDGYVSVVGARDDYGVVVETNGLRYDDWRIDEDATDALRSKARAG
jgi:N-methylhydantoinase B